MLYYLFNWNIKIGHNSTGFTKNVLLPFIIICKNININRLIFTKKVALLISYLRKVTDFTKELLQLICDFLRLVLVFIFWNSFMDHLFSSRGRQRAEKSVTRKVGMTWCYFLVKLLPPWAHIVKLNYVNTTQPTKW